MPEHSQSAAPVPAEERLHHLDVIRGLALLGVLIMNVQFWFRAPGASYQLTPHPWPGFWNVGTDRVLAVLLEAKAMSTFAMLFAVGLAIQMERAEARGLAYRNIALRRLGALFLFGVLHVLLVWEGDILHNYALAGFLCLPFLKRSLRTIKIWLRILAGAATVGALVMSVKLILERGMQPATGEALAKFQAIVQEALVKRGHGTWLQEAGFRLHSWVRQFWPGAEIGQAPYYLTLFLLGLAVWKSGVLRDPASHLPRIQRFFSWAFPLALLLGLIALLQTDGVVFLNAHWRVWRFSIPVVLLAAAFGPPFGALAWGSGILLLLQKPSWRRRLGPFAWAGRMALSNYLMQSLVMSFLFNGWGLGFYNRLGPLAGLGVSLACFGLQALLSHWWLAHFQFGPMEWLWRSITYWKCQPFRLRSWVSPEAEPPEKYGNI